MSHNIPQLNDSGMKTDSAKTTDWDGHIDHWFRKALHILERFIALVAIVALLGALGMEIYHMLTGGSKHFEDVGHLLHTMLSIVVGLEFVRMLIDTTPANILEVLTVAITRHVVLSHDDYMSNLACIACIAGLFAIRRFLIPRSELKEDMVEDE